MSEQPFVKTIKKLLEETRDLEDTTQERKPGAARRAAPASAKPAPVGAGEDDPDMALLDEIEAGLEDDLEEGLEEPGEAAAPAATATQPDEDDSPRARRLKRRRARGGAGAPGGEPGEKRPLARFLQFLGNLQERRADTMKRGRRPARMISPSLMREASGQAVDPGDPVAERRRKQIQEFRAAWVESLNLKPASQAGALKPIGEPEPAAPATAAATGPAAPQATAPSKPKKEGERKS